MKPNLLATLVLAFAAGLIPVRAQINTGSDGHDGAFNPTQSTVIDMADHPDGICQYTSVNIPSGVTVTFKPNANNTPVVWLVQNEVLIDGTVDLSGRGYGPSGNEGTAGGSGGAGGYHGGNAGSPAGPGQGPGGGAAGIDSSPGGESAAFGAIPTRWDSGNTVAYPNGSSVYGNEYLLPLIGGSGGGGSLYLAYGNHYGPGGGGGGAILIAATKRVSISGLVAARGGGGGYIPGGLGPSGGGGSGGAVRLVSQLLVGPGRIDCSGEYGWLSEIAGLGRVRLDVLDNNFSGQISGVVSQGFQPIILPASGQGVQLSIASVAGNQVAASPTGQLATPDVIIPAQQANPVPIVVSCVNVPLNTPITVTVKPMNGTAISAVGQNSVGTLASSTATVSLNLPRGGGLIYATATIPLGGQGASVGGGGKAASYAETGLTTDGERFAKLEITAALGGSPQIAYVTESGKRFALPAQARQ